MEDTSFEFWVQLLGHTLPSLLPSHRHSPKFPSLFFAISKKRHKQLLKIWDAIIPSPPFQSCYGFTPVPSNTEGTTKESDRFQTHLPSSHPDKMSRTWQILPILQPEKTNQEILLHRVGMLTFPAPKMVMWTVQPLYNYTHSICQYHINPLSFS